MIYDTLQKYFDSTYEPPKVEKPPYEDADRKNCNNLFFKKIEFVDSKSETKLLSDNQELTTQVPEGHNETVMVSFQIQQSPTKVISRRDSMKILNYLGMIGGFNGTLIMFFQFFGTYFSSNFLRALIAEKLYVRKRTQREFDRKLMKLKKKKQSNGETP